MMPSTARTIDKLVSEAQHTSDPEKLREIARWLDEFTEPIEADKARNKALEQERKFAEMAAK
jgi:hypothetical protein